MKINAVNFVCVESSYFRYVNNQQREAPAVQCRIIKIISYML